MFVRAEQRPVPHDRLAIDEHVPRPAVGPEDESGQRIGHVAEVVTRPDDEIGSQPGLEPPEVVPAEAPGSALGRDGLVYVSQDGDGQVWVAGTVRPLIDGTIDV